MGLSVSNLKMLLRFVDNIDIAKLWLMALANVTQISTKYQPNVTQIST